MSKKKTVVVKNPEVSNNINMNLTHNDVIDVAIQSQLDILEPQLDDLKLQAEALLKKLEELDKIVIEKATKNLAKEDSAKFFFESLKALEKVHNKHIEWTTTDLSVSRDSTYKRISSGMYNICHYDISRIEDYKNPVAAFKSNNRGQETTWCVGRTLSFQMHADVNGLRLRTDTYIKLAIDAETAKQWEKDITATLKEIKRVNDLIYDLTGQILDLKYNDRKVKARVVKASLSKTEEGRNILALLESATNVKLLS